MRAYVNHFGTRNGALDRPERLEALKLRKHRGHLIRTDPNDRGPVQFGDTVGCGLLVPYSDGESGSRVSSQKVGVVRFVRRFKSLYRGCISTAERGTVSFDLLFSSSYCGEVKKVSLD